MPSPFKTSLRIRFDEIDMQGVVHHPLIVNYLEIARIEYWRSLGLSYDDLRKAGFEFIVHDLHVEYLKPLKFDELIDIIVAVKRLARASFVLGYRIQKESGELAVVAEIELVCARLNIARPVALPERFREALK